MVWKVAEMAGWLVPPARAVHVNFGNVLGDDRKMLKSRSGDPVTFIELIDEAIDRGRAAVAERSPELPAAEQAVLGHNIGIGALKYAELSSDRIKDYVFDWARMLAFDGNTAPYLQYAHARICSIFRGRRRAGVGAPRCPPRAAGALAAAAAVRHVVHDTLDKFSPHRLCTYLFDLAQAFTAFTRLPVLKDGHEATRESRLALCDLTARVLQQGLALLGIEAPERM
jgi:arginyl-tRNA synthetase